MVFKVLKVVVVVVVVFLTELTLYDHSISLRDRGQNEVLHNLQLHSHLRSFYLVSKKKVVVKVLT